MEGVVIKSYGSYYFVRTNSGQVYKCKIKGKFRLHDYKSTNPLAIGDMVQFSPEYDSEMGIITDLNERKNYIVRKSTNLSKQKHIIAANIDQAFLVVTLIRPVTTLEFIDRYLVTLEAYRISAIIIFNKIDLYDADLLSSCDELIGIYEKIGYGCLKTSIISNLNIGEFKNLLTNKISVICGNSGVGKSSLINTVESDLNLKTGGISYSFKTGIHTTSNYEMFYLHLGGYIIDTPGIKSFGLSEFSKNEIYHFFPEIFKASANCKYYNCLHIHEPDCTVKKAVEKGEIAESRYRSYLNIYMDPNEKYRT